MEITPSSPNVYTVEDHEISCLLNDIPAPESNVLWTHAAVVADEWDIDNGDHSFSGFTQTSTVTISSDELEVMKVEKAEHSFTCSIVVGTKKTELKTSQKFTIYSPSKQRISSN